MTFYFLLKYRKKSDIFIGIDPLNALLGGFLKRFGVTKKLILYTVDWSEKRFENLFANKVYHIMDRLIAARADVVWGVSLRTLDIRRGQGVASEKNILVPIGIDMKSVNEIGEKNHDRKCIALIGALTPSKGVPLVLDAIPEVFEKHPDARLLVIGKSPKSTEFGKTIESYEEELGRIPQVKLLGVLSHRNVLEALVTCGIGLAPYAPHESSVSKYGDPSRVKDYLACSLPVVITDVPEIAKEIKNKEAGMTIKYQKQEMVDALLKLLDDPEYYDRLRKNAKELSLSYDWESIFEEAFSRSLTEECD